MATKNHSVNAAQEQRIKDLINSNQNNLKAIIQSKEREALAGWIMEQRGPLDEKRTPQAPELLSKILRPLVAASTWDIDIHITASVALLGHFAHPEHSKQLPSELRNQISLLIYRWYLFFSEFKKAHRFETGLEMMVEHYRMLDWQELSEEDFQFFLEGVI